MDSGTTEFSEAFLWFGRVLLNLVILEDTSWSLDVDTLVDDDFMGLRSLLLCAEIG